MLALVKRHFLAFSQASLKLHLKRLYFTLLLVVPLICNTFCSALPKCVVRVWQRHAMPKKTSTNMPSSNRETSRRAMFGTSPTGFQQSLINVSIPHLPPCICIYVNMYVYIYMCVCMYVCMYACMHACMYVCMHACMYVCMYICVYVCMY